MFIRAVSPLYFLHTGYIWASYTYSYGYFTEFFPTEGNKSDAHHFRSCTIYGPPSSSFSDSWKTGAQEKPGNYAILCMVQTPSVWDPKWLQAESSYWLSPKINSLEVPWTICCCRCSVAKSCLTLCDAMDCSMPGFSVLHCLLEFVQIHVCWVDDGI